MYSSASLILRKQVSWPSIARVTSMAGDTLVPVTATRKGWATLPIFKLRLLAVVWIWDAKDSAFQFDRDSSDFATAARGV